MLYEVEKLRPAYLILWKTDRLSRDRIDAVIAKKRLRECGVKIVYVAESIPDDDEATQILMESIYEAMAASFIVSHRKNVMRGLTYNAENALYNGMASAAPASAAGCIATTPAKTTGSTSVH